MCCASTVKSKEKRKDLHMDEVELNISDDFDMSDLMSSDDIDKIRRSDIFKPISRSHFREVFSRFITCKAYNIDPLQYAGWVSCMESGEISSSMVNLLNQSDVKPVGNIFSPDIYKEYIHSSSIGGTYFSHNHNTLDLSRVRPNILCKIRISSIDPLWISSEANPHNPFSVESDGIPELVGSTFSIDVFITDESIDNLKCRVKICDSTLWALSAIPPEFNVVTGNTFECSLCTVNYIVIAIQMFIRPRSRVPPIGYSFEDNVANEGFLKILMNSDDWNRPIEEFVSELSENVDKTFDERKKQLDFNKSIAVIKAEYADIITGYGSMHEFMNNTFPGMSHIDVAAMCFKTPIPVDEPVEKVKSIKPKARKRAVKVPAA